MLKTRSGAPYWSFLLSSPTTYSNSDVLKRSYRRRWRENEAAATKVQAGADQQSERGAEERQKEALVPVQRTQRKNRTDLGISEKPACSIW